MIFLLCIIAALLAVIAVLLAWVRVTLAEMFMLIQLPGQHLIDVRSKLDCLLTHTSSMDQETLALRRHLAPTRHERRMDIADNHYD